ncbi:MAG: hypothetical protein OXT64_07250 [Gammaproteobacteria bacterium]|nr:hypothetical protein [Gammaproteobacteria bacterium]
MGWVGFRSEIISFKTREVLPSGLEVDRLWWYKVKFVLAIVIGAGAAIVVYSLL